jgi:hypothetical protein
MEGKMNYSNREKKMEYNCDKIVKSDYGEQFLNESYSIAVVFLKTVNLTHAWQLGTELFTKLKAGLIIRTTMNKYVVLQIWKLITYLNLKKTQKNILKIRQKKDQRYYLLYLIGCSVGIMVQAKYLTMDCSRCLKTKDKLWWFSSGHLSAWDDHFYCKDCFRRLFKLLPEKIKLTFSGYKGKESK